MPLNLIQSAGGAEEQGWKGNSRAELPEAAFAFSIGGRYLYSGKLNDPARRTGWVLKLQKSPGSHPWTARRPAAVCCTSHLHKKRPVFVLDDAPPGCFERANFFENIICLEHARRCKRRALNNTVGAGNHRPIKKNYSLVQFHARSRATYFSKIAPWNIQRHKYTMRNNNR